MMLISASTRSEPLLKLRISKSAANVGTVASRMTEPVNSFKPVMSAGEIEAAAARLVRTASRLSVSADACRAIHKRFGVESTVGVPVGESVVSGANTPRGGDVPASSGRAVGMSDGDGDGPGLDGLELGPKVGTGSVGATGAGVLGAANGAAVAGGGVGGGTGGGVGGGTGGGVGGGCAVGFEEGADVARGIEGAPVGGLVGATVASEGATDGAWDGLAVSMSKPGQLVGSCDGSGVAIVGHSVVVGDNVASVVGSKVGLGVGASVGRLLGADERGTRVGATRGTAVGRGEGAGVGACVTQRHDEKSETACAHWALSLEATAA